MPVVLLKVVFSMLFAILSSVFIFYTSSVNSLNF